jgi:hypothetical protein
MRERPFVVDASDAALQLHQTCLSGGAQHFRGASDRHADFFAVGPAPAQHYSFDSRVVHLRRVANSAGPKPDEPSG